MIRQQAEAILARRTGLHADDSDDQARMRDAMRDVLDNLIRRVKFEAMKVTRQFATVADTATYYLSTNFLAGIDMRDLTNDKLLDMMPLERFNEEYPDVDTTATGEPSMWIPLRRERVSAQPTSASVVRIVSSSGSDTAVHVVVRGIVSGVERVERLALNGQTNVDGTLLFSNIFSVTKDVTVGTITVTTNSAAVTVITLNPLEYEQNRWLIRLHIIPDAVYTMEYTYHRNSYELEYDEDVIPIDDNYIDVFLKACEAHILNAQGDEKAEARQNRADAAISELKDNDDVTSDEDVRFGFDDTNYVRWGG